MTGLNHYFLIVDSSHVALLEDPIDTAGGVQLHDDLLFCFSDSLLWLESYNPCKHKEKVMGLCWYGRTIIPFESARKFRLIIQAWLQLLSEAPEVIELREQWSYIEGELPTSGDYEKLYFNKKKVVEQLRKLIQLCERVESSSGDQCLLHLGI